MFDTLNPEQQTAVDHVGSPLLIVAGAGTGKTKTLAARVARILEDGADPSRVLLLTFTRRASAEMLRRVAASGSGRTAARVWGGTFHSAANRILRTFGQNAGLSPDFTVLDHGDATDLMGMVRTEEGFGERGKRFPRKETVANIYSRMVSTQVKLDVVLEHDYPWCADHADDLKTIFTAYTAKKRANNVLDYDDMLLFWRALTVSSAGDALRDLFDHILIDEYQDTNPIQADIVRGMCRPDTDLAAVGDDAQAIYGFRAATVENMWNFAEHFPGATRIVLEQNYRSTMPILAVANGVLRQSDDHFAKELWSARPEGVTPALHIHHDEGDQSTACARPSSMPVNAVSTSAVLFRNGHHSDGLESN